MNKAQQKRFDSLYSKHVSALRRQGKAGSTIDLYSRAVRRLSKKEKWRRIYFSNNLGRL